ncbi:hypothetical protein FRC15_004219 [Serendipita sp. 397]|nr:hypothetical protein FRC15_004219 [Serendipita sp. 397]
MALIAAEERQVAKLILLSLAISSLADRKMILYKIWCFYNGSSFPFPVEINPALTVLDLKRAIGSRLALPGLKLIGDLITLYLVRVRLGSKFNVLNKRDLKVPSSEESLENVFLAPPEDGFIHFVIDAPKEAWVDREGRAMGLVVRSLKGELEDLCVPGPPIYTTQGENTLERAEPPISSKEGDDAGMRDKRDEEDESEDKNKEKQKKGKQRAPTHQPPTSHWTSIRPTESPHKEGQVVGEYDQSIETGEQHQHPFIPGTNPLKVLKQIEREQATGRRLVTKDGYTFKIPEGFKLSGQLTEHDGSDEDGDEWEDEDEDEDDTLLSRLLTMAMGDLHDVSRQFTHADGSKPGSFAPFDSILVDFDW